MTKKFKSFAAIALAAILLCGCESVETKQSSSQEAEAVTVEETQTSAGSDEKLADTADSSDSDTAETEALTEQETTQEATLEEVVTQEYNPTDIDAASYNYSFSMKDFGKTVSIADFNSYLDELQTIINNSQFKLSFCYKNMSTGAAIYYNQNVDFLTCSIIKPMFVKSLLESGVNLDEMISKTKAWSGDSNYVASLPYGTQISVRELMQRAVSYSDNSAYYLLHQYFSPSAFNENQRKLGTSISLSNSWIFTYTTAYEALLNYEDIYNYIETGGENGELLKSLMTADDVDVNMQIRYALQSKYTVAEKYGSEFEERQFHACSIVYGETPFVLTIFTNQTPETEESSEVFRELAVVLNKINTVLYTEN